MLWNSFNVTCYISKQFSSHCFFIGKNKRKTYTTLIRRMHSLGRGEGRAGLLSNSKYMHWLQDDIGLGNQFEWKLCRWAVQLSDTVWRQVSEGGWWGATEALLTLPCQLCFKFVLWRPATGKKERKKERTDKRERETDTQKEGKSERERERPPPLWTKIFPETWCKVH